MPGSVASGRCAGDRGAGASADRADAKDSAASAISVGPVGSAGPGGPVGRRPEWRRRWRFVGAGGWEGRPAVEVVAFFRGRDDRTMRNSARGPSREWPGVPEGAFSVRRVASDPAPGV